MQICKYSNESMMWEFETLPNYNCPKCGSFYEGKAKKNRNETKITWWSLFRK